MKIIRLTDWFEGVATDYWLDHMMPPSKGLRGAIGEQLLGDLRKHQPANTTENHDPMPVILQPGNSIGEHSHPEWTLIYFIDAEEVPLSVREIMFYPANNIAILLDPDTPHCVGTNNTDRPRLSLALRFAPDDH